MFQSLFTNLADSLMDLFLFLVLTPNLRISSCMMAISGVFSLSEWKEKNQILRSNILKDLITHVDCMNMFCRIILGNVTEQRPFSFFLHLSSQTRHQATASASDWMKTFLKCYLGTNYWPWLHSLFQFHFYKAKVLPAYTAIQMLVILNHNKYCKV